MKKLSMIIGAVALFVGCSSPDTDNKQLTESINNDSAAYVGSSLNQEELNNIIQSIPPPLEFSLLIENTGAKYNEIFLNPTANVSKYNSQFSKAANLGIYGADLGYINIYEKTFSAIDYLNTVYQLANDLNIGEFFDFETLKRLATNNKNLDSIVYITTKSFEKMQRQLEKTNKSDITVAMLIGGWIEGLYLTSNIIQSSDKSAKTKDLMLTVYDEHIVLDDMIKLSSSFKNNPNFEKIIIDLENLKKSFELIKETADAGNIGADQFSALTKEIYSVRNKLVE